MRVIIAGSQDFNNESLLAQVMEVWRVSWGEKAKLEEIVSGGARGADCLGEQWAKAHSIPVKQFLPRWSEFGRAAGPVRNREMAEYADMLIAFWDGVSRGTKSMIQEAKRAGIIVWQIDSMAASSNGEDS